MENRLLLCFVFWEQKPNKYVHKHSDVQELKIMAMKMMTLIAMKIINEEAMMLTNIRC